MVILTEKSIIPGSHSGKIRKEAGQVKEVLGPSIVDDEPEVVRVIADYLKVTGFIPVEAYNGEEAITKAALEKPSRRNARSLL